MAARQGQAAPVLYQLGASGNNVFHDVTTGANTVPGASGYAATPGYDLATGLGSVDAYNLAFEWQNAGSPVTPLYTSTNSNSGYVLDVAGQSTAANTPVLQWPYWGGANQRWELVAVQPGWYELVNGNSGQALSLAANASGTGTWTVQDPYTGASGQQWAFTSKGNGTYTLGNRQSGHLLDISGGSNTAGAVAVQNSGSGSNTQLWQPAEVQ